MDNESKSKLKDILSAMDPVEFKWDETNMSSTGVVAEEVADITTDGDMITLTGLSSYDTISIGDISTISIGAAGSNGSVLMSGGSSINWASQPNYTIGAGLAINSDDGKNYIKTDKHTIDIDELGDLMETLKKRLLILTPNFEQMEKYPMLKELYDEYKAMEKLLSGPDNTSEEQ